MAFDGFRGNPVRGRGTYGRVRRWNGNAQVNRSLAGGLLRVTVNLLSQDSEIPGSLSRGSMAADRTQANSFTVRQKAGEDASQTVLGLSWNRTGSAVHVELGAHGILRDVWNPIPPAIVDLTRTASGVRGLLRGRWAPPKVEEKGASLDWTVGVELDGQWDPRRSLEKDGGVAGAVTLDQEERVLAGGGFAQGRVGTGTRTDLLAGIPVQPGPVPVQGSARGAPGTGRLRFQGHGCVESLRGAQDRPD